MTGGRAENPPCRLCHMPWDQHVVFHDEAPSDAIEGKFDFATSGLYCPCWKCKTAYSVTAIGLCRTCLDAYELRPYNLSEERRAASGTVGAERDG